MKIAVAGVGYVGLSLAVLFAQNHEVIAVTTTPEKAEKLNRFISPIQDAEIERFLLVPTSGQILQSIERNELTLRDALTQQTTLNVEQTLRFAEQRTVNQAAVAHGTVSGELQQRG